MDSIQRQLAPDPIARSFPFKLKYMQHPLSKRHEDTFTSDGFHQKQQQHSSILGGAPRSDRKKEMKITKTAKQPAQERSASVTFGEDDVKDASALNSTFGEDDVKDASALNSTCSTTCSAMKAIDDIEEDGCSQQSESSLQVLYRVIASGLFGSPLDTMSKRKCCGANDKHCVSHKEEVIGTSMNDISQVTDASYSSDLTLAFASDKAKITGAAALCCGVFSQWSGDN